MMGWSRKWEVCMEKHTFRINFPLLEGNGERNWPRPRFGNMPPSLSLSLSPCIASRLASYEQIQWQVRFNMFNPRNNSTKSTNKCKRAITQPQTLCGMTLDLCKYEQISTGSPQHIHWICANVNRHATGFVQI